METLSAIDPLQIGDLVLIAVERVRLESAGGDAGCWAVASKEAVAVVICDANGVQAVDTDSNEIGIDDLMRKTPNLAAILTGIRSR